MPFVPAPGVISLDAIMTSSGERIENTYHYHTTSTIDITLLDGMAATYISWWNDHAAAFHSSLHLTLVYLRDLTTVSSATTTVIPSTGGVGTSSNVPLPNNCTIALKRQTGLAGRKNRGRIFWPQLQEALLVNPNTYDSTQVVNLVSAANALLAAQLEDNGVLEVILHRALGTFTPVVGYVAVDATIDSQRRRLPGHNRHR